MNGALEERANYTSQRDDDYNLSPVLTLNLRNNSEMV